MSEQKIRLTEANIKAMDDAIAVFDLYDLQYDTSYPFLEQRNWKIVGSPQVFDITYEDGRKSVKHVSLGTLNSFNITHDMRIMRDKKTGFDVSKALHAARICFSNNKSLIVAKTTFGPIVYMGCQDQAAAEGMTSYDFVVQVLNFIAHDLTGDVLVALDNGQTVYLMPPGYVEREYQPDRRYAHLFRD